ncbi:MAG: hypothetical protein HY782_21275 [Chloroflexi bacterium]|nr:hypothetical protein [Chloroflexota bacterium]
MPNEEQSTPSAVSNTGPLISVFQSDSFELMSTLFGTIHTSDTCLSELRQHGWGEFVAGFGSKLVGHKLTEAETTQATEWAGRIAMHPVSKDRDPSHHLGEAEVMVIAQRPEFAGAVLLLDELAARAIATQIGLVLSGFAGVLLLAVEENLLTVEALKAKLKHCQQAGTHYSDTFIEQVYQAAKEGKK